MTKRAWLLTYQDGRTRVVWSEYREVLPSGALAFYNTDPITKQVTEHIYVVGGGWWLDVVSSPKVLSGDLPTLGEPREVRKKRTH